MAVSEINLTGVQVEGPRRRIDARWREFSDTLDNSYYGTPQFELVTGRYTGRLRDGWKYGVSKPFRLWDVQATPQKSKQAMDLLTGIVSHFHHLLVHLFNNDHRLLNPLATYNRYPESEYNEIKNGGVVSETKVKNSKRWIREVPVTWNNLGLAPVMVYSHIQDIQNHIKTFPEVAELILRRPELEPILDPQHEIDIVT